jgi:hypothetical protein
MIGILLAVAISASGDPYILRTGAATTLSGAQDTAFQTLVSARFGGITYADIDSVVCQSTDDVQPWACELSYWATPSAATIKASLIAQVPWVPGAVSGKWLVKVNKSFTASAAWRTHAQSIWAELLASPMLVLTYKRINGTGSFVASLSYKRSMNQSGIAAAVAAGETLIPDGVTP